MNEDPFEAQALVAGDQFTNYLRLDIKDNQTLLVHKTTTDNIYVIFRGSDAINDFLADINIFQTKLVLPYEGQMDSASKVKVHSGFLSYWKIVRTQVLEELLNLHYQNPGANFIFLGHSLGGALAQLASLDFQFQHQDKVIPPKITCVTFGTPRVGNSDFVVSRDKRVPRTLNLVNQDDLVFYQPWEIFGYRRSGHILQIGKKPLLWRPSIFRIHTHFLDSYQANLLNW